MSKNTQNSCAYDCRNNGTAFAQAVADEFSANNIDTYLFSSLRPTPVLSFAVRHLAADAESCLLPPQPTRIQWV